MIGLKVNGDWLELPENVRISLRRTSPIFFGDNFNIIAGSYSLPFTIEASDKNRSLLEFPEFLSNHTPTHEYFCELHFDGNLMDRGRMTWKNVDQDNYRIQFFSSAGALSQLKQKTFADYDYGGEIPIDMTTVETEYPWFKVISGGWRKEPEPHYARNHTTAALVVEDALRRVLDQEGYTFETDFFSDAEYAKLLFFKNYYFRRNESQFVRDMVGAAPQQYVANALRGMASNFCLAIDIDSNIREVRMTSHNDLIDSPLESIDMTDRVISKIVRSKTRTSGDSLIKSFKFNHFDDYNSYMGEAENIDTFNILTPVDDIPDLPANADEGDAVFIWKYGHYVLWDEEEDEWDLDNPFQTLHELKIAEKGEDIESDLVPAYVGHGRHFIMPAATGRPYYWFNEEQRNPTTTGFLAFHSDAHPKGRYDIYDDQGNTVGTKSLMWQGAEGLYETNWKKWLTYLNGSYIAEVDMQLTTPDLFNWNPLQPIKLFDPHSGGYHFFYWIERKIILTNAGIAPASQKLLQLTF